MSESNSVSLGSNTNWTTFLELFLKTLQLWIPVFSSFCLLGNGGDRKDFGKFISPYFPNSLKEGTTCCGGTHWGSLVARNMAWYFVCAPVCVETYHCYSSKVLMAKTAQICAVFFHNRKKKSKFKMSNSFMFLRDKFTYLKIIILSEADDSAF